MSTVPSPPANSDANVGLQLALGESYTLERELTGGAMARVFVAQEPALGRRVVVKLVATELAEGLSADRFRREIAVAARLQHPHIVPLLAAGSAGGTPYYTMPLVEGESLRDRLARDGALPVPLALSVLRDIARALEYAHGKGVVHRDIKPDNVLIAGNAAVVTDFGIAKALIDAGRDGARAQTASTLTALGTMLGTPAYVAPEQAAGDPDVDHRADLYAFGVLAYELLASRTPFAGRSAHQMIVAHLVEAPLPLATERPDVPPSLAALIMWCLEKKPADRPPSAAAILEALEQASAEQRDAPGFLARSIDHAAAAAPGARFIAVLPFENLSPDPDDAYFADGLTDEVIADLSSLDAVRVIARASIMKHKGSARAPAEIARELGVQCVLAGSVRRAGNAVRIVARLEDVASGQALWSAKLGGSIADVFALQERLSRHIVDALRLTLTAEETRRLGARAFDDVRAYEGYLRARSLLWQGRPESLRAGTVVVEDTIARLGEHEALIALQGMFELHAVILTGAGSLEKAERLAARAASLDPEASDAQVLQSALAWARGDMADSLRCARLALERQPGDAEALWRACYASGIVGHQHLCHEYGRRLAEIDPLNAASQSMPGWAHLLDGNAARANEWLERARALDPGNPGVHNLLGLNYAMQTRWNDARAALAEASSAAQGTLLGYSSAALLAGLTLDRAALLRILTPEAERLLRPNELNPLFIAFAWARLGDGARAIEWLECAIRRGFVNVSFLSAESSLHEPLQRAPGFGELLAIARAAQDTGRSPAELLDAKAIAADRSVREDSPTRPAAAATPVDRPSVAVMPFASLSPDADDDYFADGLTDELIADLSRVRALRVISRTSVVQFKSVQRELPAIARALGVRYVLEGSVRRAGRSLRITAQLIEGETDTHLWGEKYTGTVDDVFDLQERLSREIVDALKVTLTPDEDRRLATRPLANVHAYDCYLRARQQILTFTPAGIDRAFALLRRGLELAGENALIHAALSYAYTQLIGAGISHDDADLDRADEHARRALTLDPELGQAHFARGYVALQRGQFQTAVQSFKRADSLDPTSGDTLIWFGSLCAHAGKMAEARRLLARQVELDPLSLNSEVQRVIVALYSGDWEGALDAWDRAVALDPEAGPLPVWIASNYVLRTARAPEGADYLARNVALQSASHVYALAGFLLHAWRGEADTAVAFLDGQFLEWARLDFAAAWGVASGYALIGRTDEAVTWLEIADGRGFFNYPFLAELDPFLASLRGEERFEALLVRVKRRWETLEV